MQPVRVDGEFLVHATYLNCCLKMSLAAHKWARATKISTTAISLKPTLEINGTPNLVGSLINADSRR
jgi:hypothetical protein